MFLTISERINNNWNNNSVPRNNNNVIRNYNTPPIITISEVLHQLEVQPHHHHQIEVHQVEVIQLLVEVHLEEITLIKLTDILKQINEEPQQNFDRVKYYEKYYKKLITF